MDCKSISYSSNETGIPQLYFQLISENCKPKQLTKSSDPVLISYVAPKGDRIIFLRDKDGNELNQLFLIRLSDEEIKQITDKPYRTFGVGWHPSGKEITRSFVSSEGMGLETINLETGEAFIMKKSEFPLMDLQYSNNGKWIACTEALSPTSNRIIVINKEDDGDFISYTIGKNSRNGFPSWSPNDKKLAFISEATGWGRIIIQDFQESSHITLELEKEEGVSYMGDYVQWSPKGNKVYYLVSKYGRTSLHSQLLNEKKELALPFPTGTLQYPKISSDGTRLTVLHSSMSSPLGVYFYDFNSKKVKILTPREFNCDISLLQEPNSIWYKSFDDRKIHGWYIPAVKPKTPIPAIMYCHGGPWAQVQDRWFDAVFMQNLSQNGFATLAPNYRGSTGYGAEFQNLNIEDVGGDDLKDVIKAAEWLKNLPEINLSKIAIMGGSYGGYLTLMALSKYPLLFASGFASVPVVDWLNMYYMSDPWFQQSAREMFGGPPNENTRNLYIDRSPNSHVLTMKAPIMIMAGKEDSRAPFELIEKYIEKLKEKNHPYELILEEKAGHLSALFNWEESVPIFTKMIHFFEKYLK